MLYHEYRPVFEFRANGMKVLSGKNMVLSFEDTEHKETCIPREVLATSRQSENSKQKLELFRRYHTLNMMQRALWRHSLTPEARKVLASFIQEAGYVGSGRNYISTKNGRLGFAPIGTREGDRICIFYGAIAPFVVRFDESRVGQLIGDAYVHGIMSGEAMTIDERGDDEDIILA
ncbi:MAG: hypothetical protein M1840_001071 [Geoglossum simile]|nr:MAG: hypothetical protein M1840_001071 [Geoglossum simile]